jgi:hypothetical protein
MSLTVSLLALCFFFPQLSQKRTTAPVTHLAPRLLLQTLFSSPHDDSYYHTHAVMFLLTHNVIDRMSHTHYHPAYSLHIYTLPRSSSLFLSSTPPLLPDRPFSTACVSMCVYVTPTRLIQHTLLILCSVVNSSDVHVFVISFAVYPRYAYRATLLNPSHYLLISHSMSSPTDRLTYSLPIIQLASSVH